MTGLSAIPAAWMRGGTSKGLVLHEDDLPREPAERDRLLLSVLGSPDPRQIDGVGGGHPLTSKVAIVRTSNRPDADVDYLFLQVWPDRAEVSASQNCGNMLAAVGPFAIDTGIVPVTANATAVRIWMRNTDTLAVAHVPTRNGQTRYDGACSIDGVPGKHAGIFIDFRDIAGSSCGDLFPTGNAIDHIDGIDATCVDNGMPVVCVNAADLGLSGYETPAELEADKALARRIETLRRAAGPLMNLGDVTSSTVPKVTLLAQPKQGGTVHTRTFTSGKVHATIGVFGAISVATACVMPGTVAARYVTGRSTGEIELRVEHPAGALAVAMEIGAEGDALNIRRSALLRTARLLMRGEVYALESPT